MGALPPLLLLWLLLPYGAPRCLLPGALRPVSFGVGERVLDVLLGTFALFVDVLAVAPLLLLGLGLRHIAPQCLLLGGLRPVSHGVGARVMKILPRNFGFLGGAQVPLLVL